MTGSLSADKPTCEKLENLSKYPKRGAKKALEQ